MPAPLISAPRDRSDLLVTMEINGVRKLGRVRTTTTFRTVRDRLNGQTFTTKLSQGVKDVGFTLQLWTGVLLQQLTFPSSYHPVDLRKALLCTLRPHDRHKDLSIGNLLGVEKLSPACLGARFSHLAGLDQSLHQHVFGVFDQDSCAEECGGLLRHDVGRRHDELDLPVLLCQGLSGRV